MINQKLFRPVFIARVFFVLLSTWIASFLAFETQRDPRWFSLVGFAAATLIVIVEYSTNAIASRKILLALAGWMVGLICAEMFYPTFGWLMSLVFRVADGLRPMTLESSTTPVPPPLEITQENARLICHLLFGYFGLVLALRHADWLRLGNLKFYLANPTDQPRVLDSSVIIDGRVIEMIKLGVIDGAIFIPNFVINEIQNLSDSADEFRRSRGKRGLELLERMLKECPGMDTISTDYPGVSEVDDKLVRLCQEINAELITNDGNLQKVARVNQVKTLNLNELAAALRQTVHVGDEISIQIVKTGKEPGQGVGYLDDGSMVVVDGGGNLTGQEVAAEITSMIQNPTGRMVFARLPRRNGKEAV